MLPIILLSSELIGLPLASSASVATTGVSTAWVYLSPDDDFIVSFQAHLSLLGSIGSLKSGGVI